MIDIAEKPSLVEGIAADRSTRAHRCCSRNQPGFRGIYFDRHKKRWRAEFRFCGTRYKLGRHRSRIKAAQAHDAAARKFYGDDAVTNEPEAPAWSKP